ncbi:uncharacterized protein LOC135431349 [Drosophila montana]|uniref:uncharacterized protein LOC135431349 n=1 Tax=Drosophila montana TaxID=40370 RepID=UPI00313F364D
MLRRSVSSHQRSNRFKINRLPGIRNDGHKKTGVLSSAFQTYLPFRSKETLKSQSKFDASRSIGYEFQSAERPQIDPINCMLQENADCIMPSNSTESQVLNPNVSSNMDKDAAGGGEGDRNGSELKARGSNSNSNSNSSSSSSSRRGNRFKRNIKNTGSLIVRKLTSSRYGRDTGKAGGQTTSKHSDGAEEKNVINNDKPNNTKQNVAMLRTTTL